MSKLVRDAMTPNPRSVLADAPVIEAAKIMVEENVGSVPVVDTDNILIGMITDRDITLRVVAAEKDARATRAEEIASTHVTPAYPDEPLDEALESMAWRQVRRLPVIDDDRLVGILAQADVVQEVRDKKAGRLVEAISQPASTHN